MTQWHNMKYFVIQLCNFVIKQTREIFPSRRPVWTDWNIFQYVGGCWGVLRRFGGNTSVTVKSNWQVISIIREPSGPQETTNINSRYQTFPSRLIIWTPSRILPFRILPFRILPFKQIQKAHGKDSTDQVSDCSRYQFPGKHDHHTDWFLQYTSILL